MKVSAAKAMEELSTKRAKRWANISTLNSSLVILWHHLPPPPKLARADSSDAVVFVSRDQNSACGSMVHLAWPAMLEALMIVTVLNVVCHTRWDRPAICVITVVLDELPTKTNTPGDQT